MKMEKKDTRNGSYMCGIKVKIKIKIINNIS